MNMYHGTCICEHVCVYIYIYTHYKIWTSQVALLVKNMPVNTGDVTDVGSIPGLGRSPRGGHGNMLQYSCLENFVDRGSWWVHMVAKSQTWRKQLSMHAYMLYTQNFFHKLKYIYIICCCFTYICVYILICNFLCFSGSPD